MSRWLADVDTLLYDDETVEERVDWGDGGVVVTDRRLLAFTPGGEGANYRYVDRPNVEGVGRNGSGNTPMLIQAGKALFLALALLVGSYVVDFDGFADNITVDAGAAAGLGEFMATMQRILELFTWIDEILAVLGALALLLGVGFLGLYVRGREERLVVEVAGEEDLAFTGIDDDGFDAVTGELRRAVSPAQPSAGQTGEPPSEDAQEATKGGDAPSGTATDVDGDAPPST